MKGSKGKYTAVAKDAKDAGVEMTTLNSLEEGKKEEKEVSSLSFFELMQLLLPYFWPSKGTDGAFMNRLRSTSTWMTVLLSKTCNLAAPFYIASAANDLVAGNFYPAARAMVVYSTLRLLSSFFKEMQSILYIKVKQQATIQLQELTFAHLHSLSLNWHLSKRTGSVMKSMDRGVDAANSLVTYLFLFLIPAIAECLAVSILFFIHFREWQLGMLVVVGVSLYTAVTIVITEWRKKYREATNKHDNDYHDTATDSVINYETVKYFTGEAFEIARFKKSVIAFQQFSSSTAFSLNVLNISQQLILNITMLCAMLVAGRAVVEGRMTLGGWVAIQSWIVQLFAPLNFLGSIYGAIFQAFINIRNLSELLFEQPDISDVPQAPDLPLPQGGFGGFKKGGYDEEEKEERGVTMSPMMHASELGTGTDSTGTGGVSVEFRGISFHYPEQPPEKGLKDVNVLVRPGTTTAVVGHTGAGKTTISRLLFRFYDPHSGSVLINGHDIRQYTQQSVRKAVGIVPQDTVLFNDTIAHNIRYGRLDASFEEVQAAAEAAQILTFVESLPEKWDTLVGERGLKLSGGEKQRVAIARCLLKNPPIVLLDEATSALDSITENSIQEALLALGQNRTLLVIAHRLSTIRHADQIVVLDKGRIKEVGSHEQLMGREGVYAQMWNMQLGQGHGPSSVAGDSDGDRGSLTNLVKEETESASV